MLRARGIEAPYSSNALRDFMDRRHKGTSLGSPIMRHLVPSLLLAVGVLHAADTTDANRYVLPVAAGVVVKPIFTVGELPTGSTYQMVGIPDGLGAYDNGDGTLATFCCWCCCCWLLLLTVMIDLFSQTTLRWVGLIDNFLSSVVVGDCVVTSLVALSTPQLMSADC